MKPFIETYTGNTFSPLDPTAGHISIRDIAHALSMQCRFSGHTRFHYSVAEHSVRVSECIEAKGFGVRVQLWGLLHDASEAYLVDLPRPLKEDTELGKHYRAAEAACMAAICIRFNIGTEPPAAVLVADNVLLATEVRDLMHGGRDYWKKIQAEPLPERIRPWQSEVAENEFLRRFYLLRGEDNV